MLSDAGGFYYVFAPAQADSSHHERDDTPRAWRLTQELDRNGYATTYRWEGDRLVHEAQDNQRTTVVYEPGTFVPMLRIDETANGSDHTNGKGFTTRLSAYHTDALGTPMQLVTPRGETLWQAQPDDWAAIKHERGTTAQPIRFQGQWHDEESGLYYNRHRYYDPQQGRYISQDPIGLKGGTNLYGYVTNPTGMVDPLGLEGYEGGYRAIQRSIDESRERGPGVRSGGVLVHPGSASVDLNAGPVSSSPVSASVRSISIGQPCESDELSVGNWAKNIWSKVFGRTRNGKASVSGPGVSVDMACVDPGQVVDRAASEVTARVIEIPAARSIRDRWEEIDAVFEETQR